MTTPGSIEIITYSDRVVPIEFNFLSGYGIVGLYVSVVLVVSKFLRDYVNRLAQNIPYEKMAQVDGLRNVAIIVHSARGMEPIDLELEESLSQLMFQIFRGTESILLWTAKSESGFKDD